MKAGTPEGRHSVDPVQDKKGSDSGAQWDTRKIERRKFLKAGVIGAAVAATYLYAPPSIRTFGIKPAYANHSPTPVPEAAPLLSGCSPGFWKNHDVWPAPYDRRAKYGNVFAFTAFLSALYPELSGKTLIEMLRQGGGGTRALGRHSVAALLNAAAFGNPAFPFTPAQVVSATDLALQGQSPVEIESLKNQFEGANNTGCAFLTAAETDN